MGITIRQATIEDIQSNAKCQFAQSSGKLSIEILYVSHIVMATSIICCNNYDEVINVNDGEIDVPVTQDPKGDTAYINRGEKNCWVCVG